MGGDGGVALPEGVDTSRDRGRGCVAWDLLYGVLGGAPLPLPTLLLYDRTDVIDWLRFCGGDGGIPLPDPFFFCRRDKLEGSDALLSKLNEAGAGGGARLLLNFLRLPGVDSRGVGVGVGVGVGPQLDKLPLSFALSRMSILSGGAAPTTVSVEFFFSVMQNHRCLL